MFKIQKINIGKKMKISNKEIALTIRKTPSAISYLKKNNHEEFLIVKLGVLCNKLNLSHEDLLALSALKKNHLHKIAS